MVAPYSNLPPNRQDKKRQEATIWEEGRVLMRVEGKGPNGHRPATTGDFRVA